MTPGIIMLCTLIPAQKKTYNDYNLWQGNEFLFRAFSTLSNSDLSTNELNEDSNETGIVWYDSASRALHINSNHNILKVTLLNVSGQLIATWEDISISTQHYS